MRRGRLEAFSDGVIAIVITIMVLQLRPPEGTTFSDLSSVVPVALTYLLSFAYLGIYWNNHHHMFQLVDHVNGVILWANLHLLFWLSLFPFTMAWVSQQHFATVPTVTYGVVLLMAAVAYYLLQRAIVADQGPSSRLALAIGRDLKGKMSPVLYLASIPLAFVERWVALGVYGLVALIWLVPDRRVETHVAAAAASATPEEPGAPAAGPM